MLKKDSKHYSELRKLWNQPVSKWKSFLESKGVSVGRTGNDSIQVSCPYHSDNKPSAYIYPKRGYFTCFAASCGKFEKDPVQFVQKGLKVAGYANALSTLKKSLGIRYLSKDLAEVLETASYQAKCNKFLMDCCVEKLDLAWTNASLKGMEFHSTEWLKDRGISDISVHGSIGLWPTLGELRSFVTKAGGTIEDFQHIHEQYSQYFTTSFMGWTTFIYGFDPNTVSGFKLRKPPVKNPTAHSFHDNLDEEDDAEAHDPGKQIVTIPVDKDAGMGFFGMLHPSYQSWFGQVKAVRVVEGEMDAAILQDNQISSSQLEDVYLAVGGAGHKGLNALEDIGVSEAYVIGDDDGGGAGFIDSLYRTTDKLTLFYFTWPLNLQKPGVKDVDPDKAVRLFGFSAVNTEFKTEDNYSAAYQWAYERACQAIDIERPDDVTAHTRIATEFAKHLDNANQARYIDLLAERYPDTVHKETVRSELINEEDNELAFQGRMLDWFKDNYDIYYKEGDNVFLWDRTAKKKIEINFLNPRRGANMLRTLLKNRSDYLWAKESITLPQYYLDIEKDSPTKYEEVTKKIESNLRAVVAAMATEALPAPTRRYGPGIHYHHLKEKNRAYMLSSDAFYTLHWDQDTGEFSGYQAHDKPVIDEDVFVIKMDETLGDWTRNISDWLPDLGGKPPLSKKEVLDHLFRIFNAAFKLQYQETDSRFLSLLPIYSYVVDLFNKRTFTHLRGEYASGKSTALSILLGRDRNSAYRLTYASYIADSMSKAAFLQMLEGSTLLVGLDEHNDYQDGSRESKRAADIYNMVRAVATDGVARISQGTASGKAISRQLRCGVITASGTSIHDSMDASRFKTISLVKDHLRIDPRNYYAVTAPYNTAKFWQDLRKSIFMYAVQEAPAILEAYTAICDEFSDGATLAIKDTRFRETMYPLLAIGKVMGLDYRDFLVKFCEDRAEEAKREKQFSEAEQFYQFILQGTTFYVEVGPDRKVQANLYNILASADYRNRYINTVVGLKYHPDKKAISVQAANIFQALRNVGISDNRTRTLMARVRDSARYITPEPGDDAHQLMFSVKNEIDNPDYILTLPEDNDEPGADVIGLTSSKSQEEVPDFGSDDAEGGDF